MQQKRYNHSHDQFDYVSVKNDNFSCSNEKKFCCTFCGGFNHVASSCWLKKKAHRKQKRQGESCFKSSWKFDKCRKSLFFPDYSCCSTNFNNFHHDSVNLGNGRSVDSRDSLSFSQKLHLMKSGRFQLFKGGRVENQSPHYQFH